jgi:hypothetical protein
VAADAATGRQRSEQRERNDHDDTMTDGQQMKQMKQTENVTNMKYVNSENLKIMKIGILEFWSYEFHIMLKMISDTYFRTDVRTTYT